MFSTLYLLNYNNYYNRLVKQETYLEDYMDYAVAALNATNFNPSDNVNTEHIVNIADGIDPDYAIVTNENGQIVSRWFIVDMNRKCGGQWTITLRRDVIVDFYNIIIEAPCFIEKATLSSDNPLILNQEDFRVNQIKTSETLLKDKSNCAWLVGYLSPSASIGTVEEPITVENEKEINAENVGDITNWEYYSYTNLATNPQLYKNDFNSLSLTFVFGEEGSLFPTRATYNYLTKQYTTQTYYGGFGPGDITCPKGSNVSNIISQFMNRLKEELDFSKLQPEFIPNYIGNITELQGSLIKDVNSRVYSISVNEKSNTSQSRGEISAGALSVYFSNLATEITGRTNTGVKPVQTSTLKQYSLTLEQQLDYNTTFTLDISKFYTKDIYRMICIPYPDEGDYFQITGMVDDQGEDVDTIRIRRDTALNIAQAIIRRGGGIGQNTLIYDFQLLPYCPIANTFFWDFYDGRYFINMQGSSPSEAGYTIVGNVGVVFEVKEPSFSFNIQLPLQVNDVKVENQCDMYRLCSPNYASMFDFNIAKNGGVSYFNVDCNYKPYNPYIHINPNFNLLYGQDFNDPRGLILAGDFSLSSISDAFVNYELNNKNFQTIFNRQIQNLEVQQKYQKISEAVAALTGTLSGGVSAASIVGLMGGGPAGMGVGALGGAAISGIGGAADLYINEKLRNEAIDYTKDLFGYNLENIKAQPDTLTKVSAINANNKIYPVLEYYTCTEIEKEAFRQKLKYNGMSVGIIDKIINYIQTEPSYIKGQIIRLENLNDDFHIANTIASEVNKGLFI